MQTPQQYHQMQRQLPQGMGPGPGGIGGGEGGYHMHQLPTGPGPQGQPMDSMVPVMHGGGMRGGNEMYGFQSVGCDSLEVGHNSCLVLGRLWLVFMAISL